MKLKKLFLLISLVACSIASTASLAAEATPGLRIFNQDTSDSYTTKNPAGCAGIVFPTPIAANSNAVIKVADKYAESGGVCSTIYSSKSGNQCLVSLVPKGASTVEIHVSTLSGGGSPCSAVNDHTAAVLQ